MEKISVIVPVYNVEQYLRTCLDSIINQTYSNLEIFLVDDGSTDKSLEICREYALKDNRIKVLTKKNGGQSSARNMAMNIMTGDYVSFVDSDDWLELNMYEILISMILEAKADVSVCQVYYVRGDKKSPTFDDNKTFILEGYYNILGHIIPPEQPILKFQAWNKLYKRSLLDDVRFKEGQVYEEVDFERCAFEKAQKVFCVNKPLYNYRVARLGSTVSSFSQKRLVKFDDLDKYIFLMEDAGEQEKANRFIMNAMSSALEIYVSAKTYKSPKQDLKYIVDRFKKYYAKYSKNNTRKSFNYVVFFHSPQLYYLLFGLLKKLKLR